MAGLVKFFLFVEVEAKTSQIQGAIRERMTLKLAQGDNGEKQVTSATVVGLKYVVEIKRLLRQVENCQKGGKNDVKSTH